MLRKCLNSRFANLKTWRGVVALVLSVCLCVCVSVYPCVHARVFVPRDETVEEDRGE